MKRYKSKFCGKESWETTVKYFRDIYEIFVNPSTNELAQIESFHKMKEIRAIVILGKNIIYVFDTRLLHSEAIRKLGLVNNCIKLQINFHKKIMYVIGCDPREEENIRTKFIKQYFSGFNIIYCDDSRNEIHKSKL